MKRMREGGDEKYLKIKCRLKEISKDRYRERWSL